MTVSIDQTAASRLKDAFHTVVQDLESGKDIRVALGKLDRVSDIAGALIDMASDPDTRFAFILIVVMRSMLKMYEGKTDGWYQLNADKIKIVSSSLSQYLKRLSDAIEHRELPRYVDATKDFFYQLHDVTMDLTQDIKRE